MRGPSAIAAAALLLMLISSCVVPRALANGQHHRHAWLRLHRRTLQQRTPGAKNGTLGGGSSTGGKLCAKVTAGAPAPFNAAPTTCNEFFKAPSPFIAAPADTKTVKYGQILGSGPYVIYDRDNKHYPLSSTARAPRNASEVASVWSHILVKATLNAAGAIASWQPVLYVPSSTVLKQYVNAQYEATLTNGPLKTGPLPKGVNATSWTRWSFFRNASATGSLLGTFDNLYRPVRDAKGACRPALCADPTRKSAACQYFGKLFWPNITLVWDAQVFFPGVSGSQLGAFLTLSRSGVTYVPTSVPPLYGFLKPETLVPKNFVGFNVGNPFNLPFQFQGSLAYPAVKKVVYC